jgi:hypothetical protein
VVPDLGQHALLSRSCDRAIRRLPSQPMNQAAISLNGDAVQPSPDLAITKL